MKKVSSIVIFLSCLALAGLDDHKGLMSAQGLATEQQGYTMELTLEGASQLQTASSKTLPVIPSSSATVKINPSTSKTVSSSKTSAKVSTVQTRKSSQGVVRPASYREESWFWPLNGTITSTFGYRSIWVAGTNFHNGVDIAAPVGTYVRAARSGVVVRAGWDYTGFGNVVIVDHGNGYRTLYGHNSRLLVSVGDYVSAGEVISRVGSTGSSTGPHLHFGLYLNGTAINPYRIR